MKKQSERLRAHFIIACVTTVLFGSAAGCADRAPPARFPDPPPPALAKPIEQVETADQVEAVDRADSAAGADSAGTDDASPSEEGDGSSASPGGA